MSASKTPPAASTEKIDAIDDKIHDLLMRRAAQLKAQGDQHVDGFYFSPAREATILRRLAARHKGAMPFRTVVRIWRELMLGSIGDGMRRRTVHVYNGENAVFYQDLARKRFGFSASLIPHATPSGVMHACVDDPDAFGLVPSPESNEDSLPWWTQLAPSGQHGPHIIGRLPFVLSAADKGSLRAFTVGSGEQEASEDDTTWVLLEALADLSRTKLMALLKQARFQAQLLAVGRDRPKGQMRQHLLEIVGFVSKDDPRFAALLDAGGDAIVRVNVVGSYANPIMLNGQTVSQ